MLIVKDLYKRFGKKNVLEAVSFEVRPGEIVGLVGMSGSGKSTLARCIMGLEPYQSGTIAWDGQLLKVGHQRPALQVVFQDPRSSLNPRWTILRSLLEPLLNAPNRPAKAILFQEVSDLIHQVGLEQQHLGRYPHELSTGQCQRVCIARALAGHPRLLVLDEPLSALDVSIQAQIIALLRQIQAERELSYFFISHDIAVVAALCERILVLEKGQIVEETNRTDFLQAPKHPYTRSLLRDTPLLPSRINQV